MLVQNGIKNLFNKLSLIENEKIPILGGVGKWYNFLGSLN